MLPFIRFRNESRLPWSLLLNLRDDSGQSQIEVALTCMLLLPILFGVIAFGFGMNECLFLTQAKGTGARHSATERRQESEPCFLNAATITRGCGNVPPSAFAAECGSMLNSCY